MTSEAIHPYSYSPPTFTSQSIPDDPETRTPLGIAKALLNFLAARWQVNRPTKARIRRDRNSKSITTTGVDSRNSLCHFSAKY